MRSTNNDLDLFDTICRIRKDSDGSIWQGDRGLYIIRHIEAKAGGKHKIPLAKVILNHQFLTGLFASKRQDVFTGDVMESGRKRFMVFKVVSADKMDIHIQKC